MPHLSRKVGLDIGERKIGVALSDTLGMMAHPLEVLVGYDPDRLADYMVELLERTGADEVIVGLPVTKRGEEGHQAEMVRRFVEPLGSRGISVIFRDERLSTVEAMRRLAEASGGKPGRGRKAKPDDAAAAALILQGYLESKAGSGGQPPVGSV